MMKIIDMPNPSRVNKEPDMAIDIISSGNFEEQGFEIKKIQLLQYVEKTDEKLGPYSLITSEITTNKGTIEMIYDEGFRGENALDRAKKFLVEHLGISGLILRSIIALKVQLEKNNS